MSVNEEEGRWRKRRPSLSGTIMQDVSHGAERTRAWPRKRTKAEKAKTAEQNEWFRQVQWASKYLAPQIMADIMNARQGTPFLPRDVFTMQAAGTLASFAMTHGKRMYSMATYQAVSESLDAINQFEGYILIRGPDGWIGAPYAPANSPWWWAPPSSDGWQVYSGTGWQLGMVFDAVKGCSVRSGPPVTGGRMAIAVRTIPLKGEPWKLFFRSKYYMDDLMSGSVGIVARDSISGRLMTLATWDSYETRVTSWNSLTSRASTLVNIKPVPGSDYGFFKVEYDGTNLTWSYSPDDISYIDLYSASMAGWFTNNVDQIGVSMDYFAATGKPAILNIERWVFEQV